MWMWIIHVVWIIQCVCVGMRLVRPYINSSHCVVVAIVHVCSTQLQPMPKQAPNSVLPSTREEICPQKAFSFVTCFVFRMALSATSCCSGIGCRTSVAVALATMSTRGLLGGSQMVTRVTSVPCPCQMLETFLNNTGIVPRSPSQATHPLL